MQLSTIVRAVIFLLLIAAVIFAVWRYRQHVARRRLPQAAFIGLKDQQNNSAVASSDGTVEEPELSAGLSAYQAILERQDEDSAGYDELLRRWRKPRLPQPGLSAYQDILERQDKDSAGFNEQRRLWHKPRYNVPSRQLPSDFREQEGDDVYKTTTPPPPQHFQEKDDRLLAYGRSPYSQQLSPSLLPPGPDELPMDPSVVNSPLTVSSSDDDYNANDALTNDATGISSALVDPEPRSQPRSPFGYYVRSTKNMARQLQGQSSSPTGGFPSLEETADMAASALFGDNIASK